MRNIIWAYSSNLYQYISIALSSPFFKIDIHSFIFELSYQDRGKVTTLANCILEVNGKEYDLVDGSCEVPKSEVGEYVYETVLKYNCDSYDGVIAIEVKNLHTTVIETIQAIESDFKDFIDKMFE